MHVSYNAVIDIGQKKQKKSNIITIMSLLHWFGWKFSCQIKPQPSR